MSSPRSTPAAGSTPTMKVVGRPISAHLARRSLRISSVVGASDWAAVEEGAAAAGGRTAAAADSRGGRLGWERGARRTGARPAPPAPVARGGGRGGGAGDPPPPG